MGVEESGCTCRSINLIAFGKEHAAGIQQIHLGLHGSGGEHHALLGTGDSESGSNHGIQQCFGEVVANTAYLARRRHVHTQYRVCLVQTGEGELACLHTDTVDVECRLVRLCIGSVQHDTGSSLDEVTLQHLGYEREAARCTEVTLDNLHLVVACQELNIERTGNIEFLRNLAADFLDAACRCKVNLLCREYQRSVTGVYTGKLYVLGDGVFHHFTVLGNSVELDFLGVLQELGYHHRIFLRYLSSHLQEVFQFFFIVAYIHRSTGEYVRRTHHYRIAHLLYKAFHIFQASEFLPSRLVDAQLVEHGRELVTVFGTVDGDGGSTQHGN